MPSSEFCQFRIIHYDRHTFPSLNRLGGGGVFSGPEWSAVCSCRVDLTPNSINALLSVHQTAPVSQVVEHPLCYREVLGSIPGRAMPKALKCYLWLPWLVLSIIRQALASLLLIYRTTNFESLTNKSK